MEILWYADWSTWACPNRFWGDWLLESLMIYGMYLSTMGALVQGARHATTTNNLANSNTSGFKPDFTTFREVKAESEMNPPRSEVNILLEKTGGGVWLDKTRTDFTPGAIQLTGNPLDMALQTPPELNGEAGTLFFQIRQDTSDAEQILYSREGHFLTNQAGQLVNSAGALVLNPTGQPITLPQTARPVLRDDGSGIILDEVTGLELAQVGVAVLRESNYDQIEKIGASLYTLKPGANPEVLKPLQVGVKGGAIEGSATEAIREMVNMIEGSRAYEANMTFLKIQDSTLGQAVGRLGSVT